MDILLMTTNNPGHLYPLLGLAHTLRARGHRVVFLTDDQACIREAGFEIHHGDKDGPRFHMKDWFQPHVIKRQFLFADTFLQTLKPQLILTHELCMSAFLLAERHRLPIAVLGLAAYMYPGDPNHGLADNRRWRVSEFVDTLDKTKALLKRQHHFQKTQPLFNLGDLYLLRSSRHTEPDLTYLPSRVELIGPCLFEPDTPTIPELTTFLEATEASGAQLVYVQVGRSFDMPTFLPDLVKAFREENVRFLVDTCRMDYELPAQCEAFHFSSSIPLMQVLPRCRAVFHTGMTTLTLGAWCHGLPMLSISSGGSGADEISDRILKTGTGIVLPALDAVSKNLSAALIFLLTHQGIQRRSSQLARVLADDARGFDLACDKIETLLATSVPRKMEPGLAMPTA